MENQAYNAEQKLQAIMKYAPIGLAEINDHGDIVFTNLKADELMQPAIEHIGASRQNLFPFLQFISPELAEKISGFKQPGGLILQNELYNFSANTANGPIQRLYNFTSTKMFPGCIIISFEDHTEKIAKDQAMRQVEVDRAVEQGKFEIASGVLHDIGNAVVGFGSHLTRMRRMQEQDQTNNLVNLAGFISKQEVAIATAIGADKAAALSKMLNGIADAQKASHEDIKKSITEQLRIISHIQEILNIQRQYVSGKETHERRPVNLRSIVNDCMSMLFASFDKRGIDVTMQVPQELPVIRGDRTKLMQVILNLLKNAVEAIDIDSAIKTIHIEITHRQPYLVLEVKDSGIGFDEETGHHLFDRGFTTKSSGSGIGLSNCRQILASHDATLDVTSAGTGKGCTSVITFNL